MAQLKKPTVKNPDLTAAMAAFKQKQNPTTEKAMLDAVQAAKLIAPIALQGSLEDITPDENGQRQLQASLMAVSNKNGEKFFPAFTDWLEFLKWKNEPDEDTMVLSFDQYYDILLKQNVDIRGILINPAEASIVITRDKMAELKGVPVPTNNIANNSGKANTKILGLFGTEKLSNPDLVQAAGRLRQENSPEAQNAVFQALRTGKFVAPAIMHDLPKTVKSGEKVTAKAEFVMINQGDKKFLPIFSSLSELQKWTSAPEKCCGVPLTLAQYTDMLSSPKNSASGIVIDPFTLGLAFMKDQVLKIMPRLELTELKVIPFDMLQDLSNYLKTISDVNCAYLSGVKTNDTEGHLIILDVDDKEKLKEIADAVAKIAKDHGTCVVAPIDSPMGKKAIEGKTPFYEA